MSSLVFQFNEWWVLAVEVCWFNEESPVVNQFPLSNLSWGWAPSLIIALISWLIDTCISPGERGHSASPAFSAELLALFISVIKWNAWLSTADMIHIAQCSPALFVEIWHPVGVHLNPSLAHLILLISSWTRSLTVEWHVLCYGWNNKLCIVSVYSCTHHQWRGKL